MRKIEQQDQQSGFRIDIGEYWRIVWRKKYFLIIPLVIAVIVSNVGVRFLVPIYESSTVIRVEDGGAVNEALDRILQGQRRRGEADAEIRAKLEANMLSSAFLDEVIVHLGMDRDPKLIVAAEETGGALYPGVTAEDLVLRRLRNFLKQRIKIDREGPGMFRIVYSDANPEACYVIADALASLYIDVQQRQKIGVIQDVSDFSEEQIAVYKERLDRSERALERFQRDMAQRAMVSNPVNETNRGAAETLSRQIELAIREKEGTLDKIRNRLVTLFGAVPTDERIYNDVALKKLEDNLITKRETGLLAELAVRTVTPGAPSTSETEIQESQLQIQRRLSDLVRTTFPDMDKDYRPLVAEYYFQTADLESQKQRQRTLASYIRAFQENVELTPQWESELTRLRADVEADRALYNQFRSSKTSTQISEAVQSTDLGSSIVIIEKAARPFVPVRPNTMKILALAVLFGLTIGVGGLLFTEFSDTSYRTVEEVEKQLGLKVLGTIPRFEHDTRWYHDTSRKKVLVWAATTMVVIAVSLFGFYFYGKSSREQMIDVNITRNIQR